jgi:hypothetical protein
MILKMEIFKKTVWFCVDTANQQAKYALPSNGGTCRLCGGGRNIFEQNFNQFPPRSS